MQFASSHFWMASVQGGWKSNIILVVCLLPEFFMVWLHSLFPHFLSVLNNKFVLLFSYPFLFLLFVFFHIATFVFVFIDIYACTLCCLPMYFSSVGFLFPLHCPSVCHVSYALKVWGRFEAGFPHQSVPHWRCSIRF